MKSLLPTCLLLLWATALPAQVRIEPLQPPRLAARSRADSLRAYAKPDSSLLKKKPLADRTRFLPVAKRSLMLSLVAPGAGQIYNRSYWKAPIAWGLLGTSAYFIADNQLQANYWDRVYKSTLDADASNDLEGGRFSSQGARLNRDFYLRNRDIAILGLIGAYALTAIEAFVDAHLKGFTVSDNLTLRVGPAMPLQTAGRIGGPTARFQSDLLTPAQPEAAGLPMYSLLGRGPALQVFAGMKVSLSW